MAKKFEELSAKMSPAAKAASEIEYWRPVEKCRFISFERHAK